MTRATASRQRAPEGRSAEPWRGALGFAAVAGLLVLGAYLVHPIAAGYRLPVGPDGPVYVWWTRYADVLGLSELPGARIGVPAVTLALRPYLRTGAVETVTLLGPVLAAAAGLAGAALLETALGPSLLRASAAALLTGTFAAYLAGGWLGNTALVALFLAAAAALSLAGRSWRAVAGAAALLAAAGLTHRIASLFILAILAGVVVAYVPEHRRARRAGSRRRDTTAARISIAALGGAALASLGLLPSIGAQRLPGDTSQDGFFRRLGLRDLLLDRYRERLGGDAARAAVPIATGAGLGGLWLVRSRRERGDGTRFATSFLGSWAIVTAAGVAMLFATGWGPPNRVLVFAFFLPLGAAAGVAVAWRTGRLAGIAATVLSLAFAAVTMLGWFRQSPAFSAEELSASRAAGRTVASVPPGTPLVFPFDTDEPAAAYHVTRALNVIRMGLPPERIPDAYIGVGTSADVLERRPALSGDAEHDAIARTYADEIARATRDRPPVLVVLERVDADAATGAPGLSPGALVALSIAALVLLGLLGGGWARWILPDAGARAVASAAPATGVALLAIVGVLCGHVGLDPAGWSGLAGTATVAAAGYLAALRFSRR